MPHAAVGVEADEIARECRIRFHQYTSFGNLYSISQLVELRRTAGVVARVENSGCEGYFVEIARWSDKNTRWEKFAFNKFLGGEICEDDNALKTAEKVRDLINGTDQQENIFHMMPSWEG